MISEKSLLADRCYRLASFTLNNFVQTGVLICLIYNPAHLKYYFDSTKEYLELMQEKCDKTPRKLFNIYIIN